MSIDASRYRGLFVSEARDHLLAFDEGLLRLEDGVDGEAVDALFRAAHSFKGMAATLGYDDAAALAHVLEDHLDHLRGKSIVPAGLIDHLLEAADALRAYVDAVDQDTPAPALAPVVASLRSALSLHGADDAVLADAAADRQQAGVDLRTLVETFDAHEGCRRWIGVRLKRDTVAVKARLMIVERTANGLGTVLGSAPDKSHWGDIDPRDDPLVHFVVTADADPAALATRLGSVPDVASVDLSDVVPAAVRAVVQESTAPDSEEASGAAPPTPAGALQVRPSSTVRVPVERIDRMLDQTGEVRIAQAQLARLLQDLYAGPRPYALIEALERIERETRTLYDAALDMRTLPVSLVTGRFPRLVRDVARAQGKQVELIIVGEDTQIDRSVIEVLGEPVMHLVKNAIGHGLESPAERAAAGKAPMGEVRIRFTRVATGVRVSVSDDGRGISRRRVLETALERGLVREAEARTLDDDDILGLISTPGFSTATDVTAVAGRGVGLDAVKHDVEKLGGSIQVASDEGRGTTVTLILPPTLALVETLHVVVDGEPYHIPVDAVVTTLSLGSVDMDRGSIDYVDPRDVLAAREEDQATTDTSQPPRRPEVPPRTVPLLRLSNVLGLEARPLRLSAPSSRPLRNLQARESRRSETPPEEPGGRTQRDWRPPDRHSRTEPTEGPLGLVVERHGKTVCLAVDDLVGMEEVVVKQVRDPTGDLAFVAGATVQGDGRVGLILDIPAVIGADLRATGRLSAEP